MSTDHDIMRLPDPPPPAPDARASAVQQALLRFDQKSAEEKNADDSQGVPTDIRLIERTAASLRPSRERTVMNRTRYLLAASLACIVAGSGAYLHLMWSPQPQDAGVRVERLASNAVAQAPSTVEAKKESESHAQPQMQIQTASQGRKAQPGRRRAFGCRGAASRQVARGKSDCQPGRSEGASRDGVEGSHAGGTVRNVRS
ncbi:hypothetical protein ACVW0J_005075 [Bradyrhizobium sp. i1.7.7]